MTLGKLLRDKRKESGKTLQIVHRDTEIPIRYLHEIETGKCLRPKIPMLEKLISYYDLDSDHIFHLAGKIPPQVYWKVVRCPALVQVIRQYPE